VFCLLGQCGRTPAPADRGRAYSSRLPTYFSRCMLHFVNLSAQNRLQLVHHRFGSKLPGRVRSWIDGQTFLSIRSFAPTIAQIIAVKDVPGDVFSALRLSFSPARCSTHSPRLCGSGSRASLFNPPRPRIRRLRCNS
jgi:hypothetical protein